MPRRRYVGQAEHLAGADVVQHTADPTANALIYALFPQLVLILVRRRGGAGPMAPKNWLRCRQADDVRHVALAASGKFTRGPVHRKASRTKLKNVAVDTLIKPWDETRMENGLYQFTPSDAAALTGVSTVQQRDWRRHGYMPTPTAGWSRHEVEDLCRLLLLRLYAQHGIPPGTSLTSVIQLAPTAAAISRSIIAGTNRPMNGVASFGFIWANGDMSVADDLQSALDAASVDQQAGPVTIVDLRLVAVPFGIKIRKWLDAMSGENHEAAELVE